MQTVRSFWPYYLAQHRLAVCRAWHYAGTLMATTLLFALISSALWSWLWLVLVAGYAPAWIGHYVFEKNRPATFSNPFLSLACDYLMCWYWLSGQIDEQLQQHAHVLFEHHNNAQARESKPLR